MFLEDCWYVAAWSHEIEAGKILGVQIMDTPLAIYRKEDGAVSAVLDRCPHRYDRGLAIFRRTLDRLIQEQSVDDEALIATDRHHERDMKC